MSVLVVVLVSSLLLTACNPLGKTQKSGLQVITDGTDASVYLNDAYVEKTPFIDRELSPGEYTLKIQPDEPDLIPYEKTITLRPGLLTVVTWKLAQRPEFSGGVVYEMEPINSKNKSEISFVTIPDGAIVSVGEQEKSFSPTVITDIIPGHTEFEVSLPSYESQKHTINAVAGYRMLVTVKLAKVNLNAPVETVEIKNPENQVNPEAQAELETQTQTATQSSATASAGTTNANTNPSASSNQNGQTTKLTQGQVTINPTNFFVDGSEVLRVRDFPGSSGAELGFAPVGNSYEYLGETTNNWFKISFNDVAGWVSAQYAELVQ